jgi:hypothetical protein
VLVGAGVFRDGQGSAQAVSVQSHGAFDRVGQVVPDMPTVADLHRVRCTVMGSFGIGAGPVPADDFDSGVGFQPCGQRLGGAVSQHVDRAPGLDVDQDRAVVVSTSQGEIID